MHWRESLEALDTLFLSRATTQLGQNEHRHYTLHHFYGLEHIPHPLLPPPRMHQSRLTLNLPCDFFIVTPSLPCDFTSHT
jgi:hypothetical protein